MTKWLARDVITAIANERIGGPMQEILFTYVAQQTPEENKEILLETTKELQYFSEGGKNAMTMAESLVKDGRDENMRNVVR